MEKTDDELSNETSGYINEKFLNELVEKSNLKFECPSYDDLLVKNQNNYNLILDNGILDSGEITCNAINSKPSLWTNVASAQGFGTYATSDTCYEHPKDERYELKEINGRKIVVNMSNMIAEKISELSYVKPHFTKKFPFIKFERKKYTRLVLTKRLEEKEKIKLNVDCNMSMLMKILKLDYVSWAKSIMNECVKNGSMQN